MINKNINYLIIYLFITIFSSLILYFLMFFVFRDLTDYVLCTRIEQYTGSIFSNNFNYLYTRSCDEEPYVMVLKNINNLYLIDDFQYRNRPIFLLSAWLIYKPIELFQQNILGLQLAYFLLQNFILYLTTIFTNKVFEVENSIRNYSITLILLLLSPIFKWTIFEAGSHTVTGLIFLFSIYFYKNLKVLNKLSTPIVLGLLFLTHRSFVVLFLYCLYLMLIHEFNQKNKIINLIKFSTLYVIPIGIYQLFKSLFTSGDDHNIEFYNQFFWVFDFIKGEDTNGVTGWYCQSIPQNFKCYFFDNLNTLYFMYLPVLFCFIYLLLNWKTIKNKTILIPLFEIFVIINIFWSFIGWFPPVRFSFYSWGHLIIFLSILIFYQLNSWNEKILYCLAYIFFFMFLNHYNADIYFQMNTYHTISAIFYFLVLFINFRKKYKNVGI